MLKIIRVIFVFLLLLGTWVAIIPLDFPEGTQVNDKLIHIAVFFCFAALVDKSIAKQYFWRWKGLPLIFYGLLIEILQYITPDRSFSMLDMVANFMGVFIYFMLMQGVLYVSGRQKRTKLDAIAIQKKNF